MHRIYKYFFTAMTCSLLIVSCKKSESDSFDNLPAQTLLDVSYGSHSQQKMDIYLPANRSAATTKVMILIHGGGWNTGDKTDFNPYVDSLRKREPSYAIFNINYRLVTGTSNRFPAQENDVKAAVEFIAGKMSEYKISDKIVMIGASAGAHLAMLHAFKYNTPVKIKAVVDFFGPADLIALYNNPPNPLVPVLLSSVTGYTPTANSSIYSESSPLNYVTSASCPAIILQGGADPLVPASQSEMLKNKLQTEGVAYQYVFYPSEGHGWTGANLSDSFNKIQAFLSIHVN